MYGMLPDRKPSEQLLSPSENTLVAYPSNSNPLVKRRKKKPIDQPQEEDDVDPIEHKSVSRNSFNDQNVASDPKLPRQVQFFRNGDKFYQGKKIRISPQRYRSLDGLLSDLTRSVSLPYGVRRLYTPKGGTRVRNMEEIRDGKSYVCASFEKFKRLRYGAVKEQDWRPTRKAVETSDNFLYQHSMANGYPTGGKYATAYGKSKGKTEPIPFRNVEDSDNIQADSRSLPPKYLSSNRPKLIKIVKAGKKPYQSVSLLLNKKSMFSYEQLMQDISEAFGLPNHRHFKISRLYNAKGVEIKGVADFFRNQDGIVIGATMKTPVLGEELVEILEDVLPDSSLSRRLRIKQMKENALKADSGIENDDEVSSQENPSSFSNKSKMDRKETGASLAGGDKKERKSKIEKENRVGEGLHVQVEQIQGPLDDMNRYLMSNSNDESVKELEGKVIVKAEKKPRTKRKSKDVEKVRKVDMSSAKEVNTKGKVKEKGASKKASRKSIKVITKTVKKEAKEQKIEQDGGEDDQVEIKRRDDRMCNGEEKGSEEENETTQKDILGRETETGKGDYKEDNHEETGNGEETDDQVARKETEDIEEDYARDMDDSGPWVRKGVHEGDDLSDEEDRLAKLLSTVAQEEAEREIIESLNVGEVEALKTQEVKGDELKLDLSTQENNNLDDEDSVVDKTFGEEAGERIREDETAHADQESDDCSNLAKPNNLEQNDHTGKDESNKRNHDEISEENSLPSKEFEFSGMSGRFVVRARPLCTEKDVYEKYRLGEKVGDGNFADVHVAMSRQTGEEFAIKKVNKSKLKGKENMIENEIAILKEIDHPNIVKLYEEYETRDFIYLIMDYVRGGDLFDAIIDSVKFTEADASKMVRDLARALNYLHKMNVVHRDMKPENLLVSLSDVNVMQLKLADFGLAMEVVKPVYTVCGTPTYVAPEILAETGYGLPVDLWALGVITYILLCGFPPFRSPDRNQDELFELIQSGKYEYISPYWTNISTAAKDLIDHLLVVDQTKRFTAKEVLEHPWVKGGHNNTVNNLQREVSMNLEKNFSRPPSAKR